MIKKISRKTWAGRIYLLVLALLLPISAGWVGDSLLDLIKENLGPFWRCSLGWPDWLALLLGAVVGALLFILVAIRLYKARGQFLGTHARMLLDGTSRERTVLIMGLSLKGGPAVSAVTDAMPNLPMEVIALTKSALKSRKAKIDNGADDTLASKIIKLDCLIHNAHGWQQNFRAVWHIIKKRNDKKDSSLKAILVVTSKETTVHFDEFRILLLDRINDAETRGEFSGGLPEIINIIDTGIDYENYDHVVESLNRAVDYAETSFKASHGQICVDVTSGSKIFSIAAAMVTLNRKLIFSYMNNDGSPLYYDAKIELGTLGEG